MYRGINDYQVGGDVSRLQSFLAGEGLLSYSNVSGYYGQLTEHAVKRFQAGRGIMTYGTPYTTGFGVVGRATRAMVNSLCGTTVIVQPQCQTVSIPTCSYGSATPIYDSRRCIVSYTCSSVTGNNQTPVITSFSGPTRLRVGETGTWSVNAQDPDGSTLSYSLSWGDVTSALTAATTQINQLSTFTHNYNQTGTYTVQITVRDQQGLSATATATVVVDYNGGTTSNDIRVLSPNTGGTYTSGNQMNILWQDLTSYSQAVPYEARLVSYSSPCTQSVCPLNPTYSYQIVSGFFGSSYNWLIPSSIPAGSYQIQVCRSGTLVCDVSDQVFYMNGGTGSGSVTMSVSPVSGVIPFTTTATIGISSTVGGSTACGTLTFGNLEWGDGANETVSYLGCSGYQTVTRSHTYSNTGTYTVRLYNTSGSLVASNTVTTNTTGNNLTSASVDRSAVNRGESLTVTWSTASSWSDARIRLELREANGNGVGESGIITGLPAQSGSYTWVVPSDSGACVADAGVLCSSQIVPGRQYIVRVIVYTPVNYCWGYCQQTSGAQILSTRDTSSFTIGASTGSGYLNSVSINRASLNRGETQTISWTAPSSWSDARIRLELREVNGNGVGESGIVSGLSAQTGSYSWTVPTDTSACSVDSGMLCSSQIVPGRQYVIRAIMYTPYNYCWGYCQQVSGSQILATRESSPFTIGAASGGGGSSFTALLTVTSDGYAGSPYMVNVSARTPTAGSQCSIPSSLILEYGDGQTTSISTPNSGTTACGYQYNSYTHYYNSPGTYTISIKNTVYPYEVVTSQSMYVY